MTSLPGNTPYYGGGQVKNPADVIVHPSLPNVLDVEHNVGTLYVDTSNQKIYGLAGKTAGVAHWEALGGGTDTFPITPYVVGPAGVAGYQTIQSAVNAANAAGGGIVYIMPGTYTESLTLYSGVDLYATPAVSQNQGSSVTISGTHTPPSSGHVGFNSICFLAPGATHVFSSAAAGTTHLVCLNCEAAVQNGYFFNLPNWTGILEVYDFNPQTAGAPYAVNDGGVNNTGGATFLMFSAGFGSGSNVMNLSGTTFCQGASIGCPVNFSTGANLSMTNFLFSSPVTFANNTTGSLNGCTFIGGASAAITMSSSAALSISGSVINSSNNPAIAGSGAGTLTLTGIDFVSNGNIAGTLTLAWGTSTTGAVNAKSGVVSNGNVNLQTAGNKLLIASGANASVGISAAMTAGTITINTTAVTTSSLIFLSVNTPGGTQGVLSAPSASIVNGTSFVINSSSNTDTSTVNWWLIN